MVLALSIPTEQNSINQLSSSLLPNVTGTNALFNSSSVQAGQEILCSHRWGTPPVSSCRDALAQVPINVHLIIADPTYSYGPRGQGNFDVGLPFRWISSDGKCIIDLSQTSYPSDMRYVNLIGATRVIQSQCIENGHGSGQGTGLAVEESFVITTREYRPPVIRCQPQAPATHPESSACATILNTMKASTGQTRFVASGAGPADETLPQTLTEPTGQCTITVGVTASEETASWYDIWQAAVALDGMCARSGNAGLAKFLGTGRNLTIEIKR